MSKCFVGFSLVSRLNDMEKAMDAKPTALPKTTDYRKRVDDFMYATPDAGFSEPTCALNEPFVQPGDQALLDLLTQRTKEMYERWKGTKVRMLMGRYKGRTGEIAGVLSETGYHPGFKFLIYITRMDGDGYLNSDWQTRTYHPVTDFERIYR